MHIYIYIIFRFQRPKHLQIANRYSAQYKKYSSVYIHIYIYIALSDNSCTYAGYIYKCSGVILVFLLLNLAQGQIIRQYTPCAPKSMVSRHLIAEIGNFRVSHIFKSIFNRNLSNIFELSLAGTPETLVT